MGLEDTRHVARIALHPRDPDVAYVAAVGHLFGPNEERGVFRTTDGGAPLERALWVDEDTGAIDLVMDPSDPRTLFAAMYQRRRTSFGFSAAGPGSGLYRTTDGGDTWTELTRGLPGGDKGRIGVDVHRRDGALVYALVESRGDGRGLYRSTDRGDSWQKVSSRNPRPMYFSMVRVDPNNPERVYLGGVRFSASDDGGRTWWEGDAAQGIHVDHHALWIDPADSDHLVLGNDGGVATSFDGGRTWRHHNNIAIGQFYEIGVDMSDPYRVCGGLQDNSSWCAPNENDHGIRAAQPRLARRLGRRRLLQPVRSQRSQHPVHGIAGRQLGARQLGHGRSAQHASRAPARGIAAERGRVRARRRGAKVPLQLETRPSWCRRTIRAPCTSAPITSCAPATRACRGRRRAPT